jgi:hypothetical protein
MTTSTGVWYQYVFSYDHSNPTSATSKRMYRNGVEQSGSVVSGPSAYTYSVSDLRVGMTYGQGQGISSPADGQWSMVRMYNKVLSAAEVLQNFEADRGRFGI